MNPKAAGIVGRVEDYKFSTLYGLLGNGSLLIPIEEDFTLFSDIDGTLTWLNTKADELKKEAVRYTLKRPYYKVKKSRNNNKPILKDCDLL